MPRTLVALVGALLSLALLAGCGGEEDPVADPGEAQTASDGTEFSDVDVEFATAMIQHHAQALVLVDLAVERPLDPQVEQVVERVRDTQGPEIEQMTTWLTAWDRPVPETVRDHANAHGSETDGQEDTGADMPGMLSAAQLEELGKADDDAFADLWLEMMIEHHRGAVEMARQQQSQGLNPDAVALAKDIEQAQQAEIATMEDLLGS